MQQFEPSRRLGPTPSHIQDVVDGTDLRALCGASLQGKRSTMYLWIFHRYDQLTAYLAAADWPGWRAIADTMSRLGLSDARGQPPSAYTARRTYFEIKARGCSATARQPSSQAEPPSEPSARAPVPHASPVRQRDPVDVAKDDEVPQIVPTGEPEFRFASFKS